MKVLHIIDSLATGGAEKLVLDTVPLFVQRGYTVDVLLLNGEKTPFYVELAALNCCRIFSLGKSYYNPLYILKIGKYLPKYDLVHVHLFPAQYFALLAKLLFSNATKLVFTEHNTTNSRLENPAFKQLERFIYRHYNRVICITPKVQEALVNKLNIPSHKLQVITNGIKCQAIQTSPPLKRHTFGYQQTDVLLIMVAGFRKQKDQDTIIRAMQRLPSNFHLILVGDGERRTTLENLVGNLRINDRVRFLGVRSDVYSLLKMADIAILSSHWEGFGLAAAEAMAAGTPVIASNVPGLAQVVKHGGVLFEAGNDKELEKIIRRLSTDKDFYLDLVDNGFNKAKLYDIERMIIATDELYNMVINE